MSRVYNWQIGRDMSYPYEEAHPSSQSLLSKLAERSGFGC